MQPDDTPPPKPRPRRWARIIGWSWALFLLLATLTSLPVGDTAPPVGFATCLICGERGAADAILNIFLFVPLGLVVGARLGLLRAFALGAGLSAMIEVAQTFLSGRYATLGDVLWNATGALVGVVLYRALAARAEGSAPREPAATMLPILTGLVVLIGGWLLGSAPTDEAYWGQWTPDFGTGTRYPGAVLDARFNAHPFPSARLPASWSGADMLRTDWTLEGSVLKEGVPRSYTSVLSIYDGQQREILYLGAFREHLVLRERMRAQDLRLDRPQLLAADVLSPVGVGDTMRVTASRAGDDRCVAVDHAETCGLGFTAGRLWTLLGAPAHASSWLLRTVDSLWLLALFFPVGLFAGSGRRALVHTALALVIAAVGVGLTRLGVGPWTETAAAVTGAAVGHAAGALLRRVAARGSRPSSRRMSAAST